MKHLLPSRRPVRSLIGSCWETTEDHPEQSLNWRLVGLHCNIERQINTVWTWEFEQITDAVVFLLSLNFSPPLAESRWNFKADTWSTCFQGPCHHFCWIPKKQQKLAGDLVDWRNCKLLQKAVPQSEIWNGTQPLLKWQQNICLCMMHSYSLQFPSRLSMLWAFFSSFFSSFCGDRNSWEADFTA